MFANKRVFISGGAGVIGQCLTKRLAASGAVVLVGDLKPIPAEFPSNIQYRRGDLNHMEANELTAFAPDIFFHLAATFERSQETPEFWEENYQHNVRLSHHLIDLCRSHKGLTKVVFASSYLNYQAELYTFNTPADKAVILSEDSPVKPRNLCGAAKFYHEAELKFLTSIANVSFEAVSARIFRSYGKGSRDIVSRWAKDALDGKKISIFAEEGMFDYIFADDVAQGLLRLAAPGITGIVNLGRGEGRRVRELIEIMGRNFPELKKECVPTNISYEASEADMERFDKLTGWHPQRRLEDTVPEIIQFLRHHDVPKASPPVRILVTSISRKIPMIQAIRKGVDKFSNQNEIHGADSDTRCLGRRFVDNFWHMPPIKDLRAADIVSYCTRHGITAIIPSRDGELSFFAQIASELKRQGINVMISPPEAVRICLDKFEFFRTLHQETECPPIPTSLTPDDFDSGPFAVKERFGAGSANLALGLDLKSAIEHAAKLQEPVFQPIISGLEYSIDVYLTMEGVAKGAIARIREQVVKGESMITTTKRHTVLEEACINTARRLGLYGHVIFQAIEDNNGELHLVECNCRFGGASTLSVAAGLDSFYWFLTEAHGDDCAALPFLRSKEELRQVRYPADLIEVSDGHCV